MKFDLGLFSLVSFEIQPIDDEPILLKKGKSLSFSIDMTLCFSPTVLKLLTKRASSDGNALGEIGIVTTINYIDKEQGSVLSGFYSPIPETASPTTLLHISNQFSISSEKLPRDIVSKNGIFQFRQIWMEKNNNYSGDVMKTSLPILQEG